MWLSIEQDLSIDMMHLLFQVLLSLVLAIALGNVIYWYAGSNQTKTATYPERHASLVSAEEEDLSDDPKLTPKHNIFLSHSGAQKPFVEQLCKDLEAGCRYPFMDIRDTSLPKGKKFAPLIFQAARQCRVAVIVLPKEFLSSKWPMLELAEFVNAIESDNKDLILLPLFYQLSVSDLSDESISKTWVLEWTKLAGKISRSRVDTVENWKKAVKELRSINGLSFANYGNSEVTYREAVVKAIFKAVPPDLLYDTSEVQGCDRMCKILSEMFVEQTSSSDRRLPQPQKLGLYGMGGLGKTTMCKALCNLFQAEFCGRVCHVELGSEIPLTLQKRVLKNLLRVSEDVLQSITNTSVGQNTLREKMRNHPVFLVIDNVGDDEDSRTEARAFLRAKFHPLSKIMVTSRSEKVVEALLEEPEYCKPIPDLTMEEAAAIFLSIAAPGKEFNSLVSSEERNIVDDCLKECLFSPDGDSNADLKKHGQYHPLALGALGVYFHDISSSNLLLWKSRLHEFDKLKRSRDCPRIFQILGLQFGTFDETKKLIFLDVALYARGWLGSLKLKSFEDCVMWLGALHNERNLKKVEDKLGDLQRNAMINLGESAVTTHDLYKEYAEWYVSKDGDAKARWCVYQEHAEDLPHELKSSAPGGWWPDLMRISMQGHLKYARISSKKVQEWRNVLVLQLHSCSELKSLDLHGFSCLCHLELGDLKKLETLVFAQEDEDCPLKLQFVLLTKLTALKLLPSFRPCTALRMFSCTSGITSRDCLHLTEECLASLESCSRLETFEVDWFPGFLAPNLSAMTLLKKLSIVSWGFAQSIAHPIEELKGLGFLTNLRSLNLSKLPVKRLPGLENLWNLRVISLDYCVMLTELPDLSGLPHVEVLNVSWTNLQEIHGLDRLLQLQTLDCRYCSELVALPDLDHLSRLRTVVTRGCSRLTKHPRVPKHPCVHDKDPIIVRRVSQSDINIIPESSLEESEDDFDAYNYFEGGLFG